MMTKFNASEKYRKYFIELEFIELSVYTVWGTDMEDGEDKLLVTGDKLFVLDKSADIRSVLLAFENPYLDKENFKQWVDQENLTIVYNTNDMKLLFQFELAFLEEKSTSLELLNAINLVEDFAIQVSSTKLLTIFGQLTMANLKDYLYNNHFWTGGDGSMLALKKEENEIQTMCKALYTECFNSLTTI